MVNSFHFYTDPGHGWLKVPLKLLEELEIGNKISPSSYMRGDYAYLEEDGDTRVFTEAWGKATGKDFKTDAKLYEHYSDYSRIRSYDAYAPLSPEDRKVVDAIRDTLIERFPKKKRKILNIPILSLPDVAESNGVPCKLPKGSVLAKRPKRA